MPFWKVFFLFERHHRESTSLKHTAAYSALSLETLCAVVGPVGLSGPGEDRRRVGNEHHAPHTPMQRIILGVVRGFPQAAVEHGGSIVLRVQILLFTGVLRDGRGGRALSAALLAGCSRWVSVGHLVGVFWIWGLFFTRGRVVNEQKWDSFLLCFPLSSSQLAHSCRNMLST